MPLVVSSLTEDASDVFDWILSLNHGEPQDIMTLLQMLREHYCGSLTFREQRNSIENLRQKPNEAAIDFLIRVGTSVGNLAKDWKDELTEGELQALQYEVSLNGVKEEIRHVLDSEMAKRDGHLTPQQMYKAVKRYETYVAQNKRLDGKGTSTSAGQQKTTSQALGYKPRFHKTTTFIATAGGPDDEACRPQIPCLMRILTPRRLSLLTRKMRDCTSLVTSRRLYQMILFYKLGWLGLYESRR